MFLGLIKVGSTQNNFLPWNFRCFWYYGHLFVCLEHLILDSTERKLLISYHVLQVWVLIQISGGPLKGLPLPAQLTFSDPWDPLHRSFNLKKRSAENEHDVNGPSCVTCWRDKHADLAMMKRCALADHFDDFPSSSPPTINRVSQHQEDMLRSCTFYSSYIIFTQH